MGWTRTVGMGLLLGLWLGSAAHARADAGAGGSSGSTGHEGFFMELSAGFGLREGPSEFEATLRTFGFVDPEHDVGRTSFVLGRRLLPYFAFALTWFGLDCGRYERPNGHLTQLFGWDADALGGFAQFDWSLPRPGSRNRITLFLRLGGGVSSVDSRFDEVVVDGPFPEQPGDPLHDRLQARERDTLGLWYGAGAGFIWMPHPNFGFMFEGRAVRASGLENAFGQARDLGGTLLLLGLRGATWEG